MRNDGGCSDAKHLRHCENDERKVAGDTDSSDCIGAESPNPVQVDEEVQSLKYHRHEHEAHGFQQMARNRAGRQILHIANTECRLVLRKED
jgi:hypothetical protein